MAREDILHRDFNARRKMKRPILPNKFGLVGLRIGEVSKKSGIPIVTIRFYETQGLVAKGNLQKSKHRRYNPNILKELEYIRLCRLAGLSLPEIKSIMKASRPFKLPAPRTVKAVYRVLESLRSKIIALEDLRTALKSRLRNPSEK